MSHYMTALAMKQTGLKPAAKIVLYWLADHHNGETGACFPSLATLARECEMDKATVTRHLATIEDAGLISRQKRSRENGSQTSTAYILHLTPVADCNSPCRKTQQPPVANCAPHNLGNNNLGSEPEDTRETALSLVPSEPSLANDLSQAVADYNDAAQRNGWPRVQKLTPARSKALKARLRDAGGLDGWRVALEKAEASDFCREGWRGFGFDSLTSQSKFTKLMEGNYDNRTGKAGHSDTHATDRQIAFAAKAARAPNGDCF